MKLSLLRSNLKGPLTIRFSDGHSVRSTEFVRKTMKEGEEETTEFVTPGEVLGNFSDFKPGRGAYVANNTVYASLSGFRRIIPPPSDSSDLVHSFTSVHCFCCLRHLLMFGFYFLLHPCLFLLHMVSSWDERNCFLSTPCELGLPPKV